MNFVGLFEGPRTIHYLLISAIFLRAILLGVDFPRTRLLEVHEYCSQYDACVARIIWINGQPFVDWVPPNEFRSHSYKDIAENYHLLP